MAFLRIALSSEPVTIGVLMDSFGVSRNTVIADVHEIRESLDSLGLSLSSVAAAGYEGQALRSSRTPGTPMTQSAFCKPHSSG